MKRRALFAVLVVGLSIPWAAIEILALVDLSPDAVTMATTSNLWYGEEAWLTDGRFPGNDPSAAAMQWDWIGLVAVSWPDTVRLQTIRVYLGELHAYRIFGYRGGGFSEEGTRLGTEEAEFGLESTVPEGVAGWYEIAVDADSPVDNISFQVIGGATIYEMQFLGPDDTVVRPTSLALLKSSIVGRPDPRRRRRP